MAKIQIILTPLGFAIFSGVLSAQASAKVDFVKDIQPLLRQNCVGCHGSTVQQAGMRLDRKSSTMKQFSRRVTPGSSANSLLYHRISGTEYGPQMPPSGAMRPEQIALVKAWIDQGADWPDAMANEKDLPPVNPQAISMVESLRTGDMAAFMTAANADHSLLNSRGPEGSTPFMYAVLYSDAPMLTELLKLGADPNKRNDANATALMWAARGLAKTRILVDHGADVNAKSNDMRTPLMIAARRNGAAPVVKFLLDHKANPNPNAKPYTESSPLMEALTGADAAIVETLIQHGADAQATGDQGISLAVFLDCGRCLDLILPKITGKDVYTAALLQIAVMGDRRATRLMLDHGADVNAFDSLGRTALMYAAVSDLVPVDVVKLLIERGADVNAKDSHKNSGDTGITALDIAKRNGSKPIIALLLKAGAKDIPESTVALKPRRNNTIRSAVQDSLPLLQRADASFSSQAGCVSCHNNSITAMAVGLARARGLSLDEKSASGQVQVNVQRLEQARDQLHQGFGIAVGDDFFDFINGFIALGLHAEGYKPDLNTDAVALFMLSRQTPSGNWPYPRADARPPICLNYVTQTAISMRVLQLYAPRPVKPAAEHAIQLAASWLARTKPSGNEDRVWRLKGLVWAGADTAATRTALKELRAAQRSDGGWTDLPSMKESTAFATGESLVALHEAGVPISDPAYQRGMKFLLDTQQEDGSWYAKTRALAFQPSFDAGFPHGVDQFMSAAATGWASMALALALPEGGATTASLLPNYEHSSRRSETQSDVFKNR